MPRKSPEYIFNREYEKLFDTVDKITEDDLSELALILRKLLLDGYYQRAGKKYSFKPVFNVTDFNHKAFHELMRIIQGTGSYILGQGDMLYPKNFPQLKSKSLSWKEFIDYTLGSTNDFSFTVRDLIKFEAHVEGAVHYRKPHEGLEKALEKNNFFIGNIPMTLRQLRSVAYVTLTALEPLYQLTKDIPR